MRLIACATLFALLPSCAVIDGAVPPRVYSLNLGSDTVHNQGILLNIVRASYDQPLTFVALSKITDTGYVQGTLGIPTVNEGSALTQAQRIFSFGPNSAQAQIAGSFDLGLLETTDFYNGILTPVTPVTINLLLRQGFPRELVLYALIDSIRVTNLSTHEVYQYNNDPTAESDVDCPNFDYSRFQQPYCDEDSKAYNPELCQSGYSPAAPPKYAAPAQCIFHRFEYFMQKGMQYGISAEARSRTSTTGTNGAADKPAPAKTTATEGHICFDPALSYAKRKAMTAARDTFNGICDGEWARDVNGPGAPGSGLKDVSSVPFPFAYYVNGKVINRVSINVEFVPRSTFGLFRYLGRLLATQRASGVKLYSSELSTENAAGDRELLNIVTDKSVGCFAYIDFAGTSYCVPFVDSANTKRVFGLLTQLIALSIKPSDLPITPTVQVTP
jgi:hypothetical protein